MFDNDDNLQNFSPLSASPTKWSNTLKQFVGNLRTNCLSVFDHFRNLALKGLKNQSQKPCTLSVEVFHPSCQLCLSM